MANKLDTTTVRSMIIELRGEKVILDTYLAMLYQVSTKRLMEQVKRNRKRFPPDFMFQLTRDEWHFLRSQFATSSPGGRRYRPYVFTRNGANMVSAILKSPVAVQRSIQIMRAFSALEEVVSKRKGLLSGRPDVLNRLSTHSKAIMHLFKKDQIKTKEIGKIKKVINEMIISLQNMVAKSL
jgi:methyl-accepting chemotaxis protein